MVGNMLASVCHVPLVVCIVHPRVPVFGDVKDLASQGIHDSVGVRCEDQCPCVGDVGEAHAVCQISFLLDIGREHVIIVNGAALGCLGLKDHCAIGVEYLDVHLQTEDLACAVWVGFIMHVEECIACSLEHLGGLGHLVVCCGAME